MESTKPVRTIMTTKSRKIQPGLKNKAEQFLAKAASSQPSPSSVFPQASRPRKRKRQDVRGLEETACSKADVLSEEQPKRLATPTTTKKSERLKSPEESEEKRMKRFRKQAPQSYLQKLQRAQTQRYFLPIVPKVDLLTSKNGCLKADTV